MVFVEVSVVRFMNLVGGDIGLRNIYRYGNRSKVGVGQIMNFDGGGLVIQKFSVFVVCCSVFNDQIVYLILVRDLCKERFLGCCYLG